MRRYIWWFIFGVLAFTVGTLFRLAELSGVPLFRMFGFLGIVLTGILFTYRITSMQMRSGREELLSSLASLPGVKLYQVPAPLPAVPRLVEPEVIAERDGTYYFIASAKLPDFRGRRYKRRLRSAIVGFSRLGDSGGEFPLRHVLVLLRRRLREDEQELAANHGVLLVNPESLQDVLL